jgi:hypothetical protein
VELYLYSPNTPSWRGAQLKHRDTFTFTITYFTVLQYASISGGRTELSALLIQKPTTEHDPEPAASASIPLNTDSGLWSK